MFRILIILNLSNMSLDRQDEGNGRRYQNPELREFDAVLEMMTPDQRPDFMEKVYERCLQGNYDRQYLEGMAEL